MVDEAASRTDALPDERGVEEAGPFVAAGHRFVLRSAQTGLLAVLADRLRDLRAEAVPGPTAASDQRSEAGGSDAGGSDAGGPDGGGPGGNGSRASEVTELRIARRGPSWLDHPWGVWRDGEPCETTVTDDYIVPYVLWEVTRLVLERAAPLVPVHAAAVARDGRAVILVGPSHAGKSTLSAWLTRAGWGFLTDEVALLDLDTGGAPVVRPFWRPVGVRRRGPLADVIDLPGHEDEVLVPASQLGSLAPATPLAAVVCPTYTDGGDGRLEPLSPAAALAQLAAQLPDLGTARAAEVFHRVAGVLERVPASAIAVDDLDAAEIALRQLVERTPAPADVVEGARP